MSHYLDTTGLGEYTTQMTEKYKTIFATKADVGTPLVAATASAMTDTTKIYVYTGSETGYTAGNWYYYNGSAWVSGGVYNSVAVETDTTLSESGMAADAKSTGDAIEETNTNITDLKNALFPTNSHNLLYDNIRGVTGTSNGVTYTWSGNTCTVTGTASATSYNWLDAGAWNLPEGMSPGDTIYMKFQSAVNGLQMIVVFYTSSSAYISGSDQIASIDKTFTVPSTAAKLRVALIVAKNVTFSSPVTITLDIVRLYNSLSDKELTVAVNSHSSSISSLNSSVTAVSTKANINEQNLYSYNSYNWVSGHLSPTSGSLNGITYSWAGNTCTISGTATATATNYLDTGAWTLPTGLNPGNIVYMRFQNAVTGVQMMVVFYTSNDTYISGSDQIASIDKTFTIPSTAAKWRIALVCASGVSIDSSSPVTVTLDMIRVLSAPTNAELLAGQSSFTSQLNALKLYTGQNASIDKTKLAEYQLHFYDSNVAEAFAFFTDPHLVGSAGELSEDLVNQYVNVLEGTVKRSSAAYVVCGGDWLNISHTKENASYKLGYVNGKMNSIFPDMYFPVAGNHDFNYLSGQGGTYPREDWITPQALHNFWFSRFDHCYYKFKKMTAMNYVLDTEVDENTVTDYEKAMLDWFAANLISDNPAHSTIFFHVYYLGTPGSSTIPAKVLAIGKIIQAFNAHTTCTLTQATEMYAKTYDFTGTTGHIDFAMCGHSHQDFDTTIGGVPCIGTTLFTDGYKVTFDMAFADYTGGKLYLTRFGTGSSRTFDI